MENTIKPGYTERFPLIKEVVSSYGKLTVSEYLDVTLEEAEHSSARCPEILAKDDISREVKKYRRISQVRSPALAEAEKKHSISDLLK